MWIAQPKNRTVRVYAAQDIYREFDENGALDGDDVLPGLTLPLRDWFAELDRHG